MEKRDLIKREESMRSLFEHIDTLVKEAKVDSPRTLVEALIRRYQIELNENGTIRARRTRTRITPVIRDKVKKLFSEGLSVNKICKQQGISYVVVSKIVKGGYDTLG